MFHDGASVAAQVTPTSDEQVQPNGVDLTLAAVREQRDPGLIGRERKEIGERSAVAADVVGEDDREREVYYLSEGSYVVQYEETIRVPPERIGFVLPRSSLLRNSCSLHTAVWDAGYEGRGEGLLRVGHDIEIERGARIGQFVLADAEDGGTYDGSYQGENL